MKRTISIILALLMTLCMAFAVSAEDFTAQDAVGMSVIGFSSVDVVTGETVTSDIVSENVVTVINEWAEWCGPCMNEMPHFQTVHEYYSSTPEADVRILGCFYGTSPSTASNVLVPNGYTWTNVIEDTVLGNVFSTSQYIPQTIIVDRHGVVRAHVEGSFPSAAQLRQFIDGWYETLLAEEGPITPPEQLLGDVNSDGVLDSTDALIVLRMSLGIVDPDPIGDVNGDGGVDSQDALLLLRMSLGIIQ
jgi:thiol-disulfide isomerase/thioredoxin